VPPGRHCRGGGASRNSPFVSVSSVLSVIKIRRLLPQQSRVSPRRSRLFRPWSAQWPCRRQPAQPHSENPGVTGGPSGPGPRYQRPGPVGCADGGSATRSVETGRQRRIRRRAGHTTIEASTMQPRHSVSRQPQLGFLRQPNLRTLSVSSVLSVVKIRRLLPRQRRASPRRARRTRRSRLFERGPGHGHAVDSWLSPTRIISVSEGSPRFSLSGTPNQ
jgi:hypothetical protein